MLQMSLKECETLPAENSIRLIPPEPVIDTTGIPQLNEIVRAIEADPKRNPKENLLPELPVYDTRRRQYVEGLWVLRGFLREVSHMRKNPYEPYTGNKWPERQRPVGLQGFCLTDGPFYDAYSAYLDKVRVKHLESGELLIPDSGEIPGADEASVPVSYLEKLRALMINRYKTALEEAQTGNGHAPDNNMQGSEAWQMRIAGFELGLGALGFEIKKGKITQTDYARSVGDSVKVMRKELGLEKTDKKTLPQSEIVFSAT